jgi:hypothetical protein
MTFYDQHSSPNDPRGLERILDARAVFSPYIGMRRTVELLRAYGVDAVVLNERFVHPPSTDYWSPTKALAGPMLEKFRARPDLFRPLYESPGASVFALTDAAHRGALPEGEPAPRPFASADTARGGTPRPDGAFVLRAAALSTTHPAPADTLVLTTHWSLAGAPPPAGNYAVSASIPRPAGRRSCPTYGTSRTSWSMISRRAGACAPAPAADGALAPTSGARARWSSTPRASLCRRTWRPAPSTSAWRSCAPHYPNTHVADYLHDRDQFSGPVVGSPIAPRALRSCDDPCDDAAADRSAAVRRPPQASTVGGAGGAGRLARGSRAARRHDDQRGLRAGGARGGGRRQGRKRLPPVRRHPGRASSTRAGRRSRPRWSRAADVVPAHGGALTGQCALWAKAHGRRFVFAARTISIPVRSGELAQRVLYRWGLHHADRVLVQSAFRPSRSRASRHRGDGRAT